MEVDTVYNAFGVGCRFTFPVPELGAPVPGTAADCDVVLGTAGEALAAFSGSTGSPDDTARADLGDGTVSTIERGERGDHLLRYADVATFHITAAVDQLLCSPVDPPSLAWRRYLFDTGLGSVSLVRGFEALHAGAVLSDDGVVAIVGQQGGGKSTLTTELLRHGWPLFTDDILAIARGPHGVVAHCGPPLLNLSPILPDGTPASEVGDVLASFGDEQWIRVQPSPVATAPVAAIALLERGEHHQLEIDRLPSSPTPLLPHSLRSGRSSARLAARFDLCADLAASVPLVRVRVPMDVRPRAVVDALVGTLQPASEEGWGG